MTIGSEKASLDAKIAPTEHPTLSNGSDVETGESQLVSAGSQHLQRKLRSREVQLFAIGGAIGTSLYVQMGSALPKGGPAGLFIGFLVWGAVMLCVNECFGELLRSLGQLNELRDWPRMSMTSSMSALLTS